MKLKRLGEVAVFSAYCFVMVFVFVFGLLFLYGFISEPFDAYYVNAITMSLAMLLVPIYGAFYKNKFIQKLSKVIFLIILLVLLFSADFFMMGSFELIPYALIVLALFHLYRVKLKSWLVSSLMSVKEDSAYLFKKVSRISSREVRSFLVKIIPLVFLYLLAIINFLGNSNYEALVVSLVALPLIIYIFTKDSILKKYLQYLLYLVVIGLIIYWIRDSYGWIWSLFNGYFGFSGFSCFFTGCYGETGWNVFIQSAIFTVDLKILFYIGIIYLAIRGNKK